MSAKHREARKKGLRYCSGCRRGDIKPEDYYDTAARCKACSRPLPGPPRPPSKWELAKSRGLRYCSRCGRDDIKPVDYYDTASRCRVCYNKYQSRLSRKQYRTVLVPAATHKGLKQLAKDTGIPMTELTARALTVYLEYAKLLVAEGGEL